VQHEHLGDLAADGDSGLSAVIGSWKIIEMRLPRRRRISAAEALDLRAVEPDRPAAS
jgi:hypothetical protein